MIISIAGKVAHKGKDYAVIEAAGLGYQVFVNVPTLADLELGKQAKLWTHEHIREDARDLFGFLVEGEYRLFKSLIAISGVGPKMCLNILSLGKVEVIEKNIDAGDVEWLSQVSGVGKKTAQKIILELKGKLVVDEGLGNKEDEEVFSALVNLGYDKEKARAVLAGMKNDDNESVEDRLRVALKTMGR